MFRNFSVVGALVLIVALAWLTLSQQPSPAQAVKQPTLQQWEYKAMLNHGDQLDAVALNKLGSEGWELSLAWTPTNRTGLVYFILKRPSQ